MSQITVVITDEDENQSSGGNTGDDENQPSGTNTGDDENQPSGTNTGDDENQPSGGNAGDDENQPSGTNTGDDEDQPSGTNTGDDENQPSGTNTGDDENQSSGDNTGDDEQHTSSDAVNGDKEGNNGAKESTDGKESEEGVVVVPNTGSTTWSSSASGFLTVGFGIIGSIVLLAVFLSCLFMKRKKVIHSDLAHSDTDFNIKAKRKTIVILSLLVMLFIGVGSSVIVRMAKVFDVLAAEKLSLTSENVVFNIERTKDHSKYTATAIIPVTISANTTSGYSLYAYVPGTSNSLSSTDVASSILAGTNDDYSASNANIWGIKDYNNSQKKVPAYNGGNPAIEDAVLVYANDTATSTNDKRQISLYLMVDDSIPAGTYTNEIQFFALANETAGGEIGGDVGNKLYLQDVANWGSTVGGTITVYDARDDQEYTVARLGDQKLWMTKNLNIAGGTTLTSADTNLNDIESYTLPVSDKNSFISDDVAHVYNSGETDCSKIGGCYSYYNYPAATANTASVNDSTGKRATSDICPKGWRLPTDVEYSALISIYPSYENLTDGPFSAKLGGYLSNGGANFDRNETGYYYSSVVGNFSHYIGSLEFTNDTLSFTIESAQVSTTSNAYRSGFSLRCVSTSETTSMYNYTLTYDANGGLKAPREAQTGYSANESYDFILSSVAPMRVGYTFLGWNLSPDSTTALYQPEGTITVSRNNSNVRLYAVWKNDSLTGTSFDDAFASAGKTKTNGYFALQDMSSEICSAVGVGQSGVLIDKRDNQIYNVRKLYMGALQLPAEAKCWMTTNLNLGDKELLSDLNNTNTNIASGVTISTSEFSTWIKSRTLDYDSPMILLSNSGKNDKNGNLFGPLYNYAAASANTVTMGENENENDAIYDLCPSGWRLPTGNNGGEYSKLVAGLGGLENDMNASTIPSNKEMNIVLQQDVNFALAGSSEGGGSNTFGYYWTSSRDMGSFMYVFMIGSGVSNDGGILRNRGISIRCIAQ